MTKMSDSGDRLPSFRLPQAEGRARSEAFSAIEVMDPTIWLQSFAGMTPED
jgi:hypothetical protein